MLPPDPKTPGVWEPAYRGLEALRGLAHLEFSRPLRGFSTGAERAAYDR